MFVMQIVHLLFHFWHHIILMIMNKLMFSRVMDHLKLNLNQFLYQPNSLPSLFFYKKIESYN